jgi:hypothetical protein
MDGHSVNVRSFGLNRNTLHDLSPRAIRNVETETSVVIDDGDGCRLQLCSQGIATLEVDFKEHAQNFSLASVEASWVGLSLTMITGHNTYRY